MWGCLKGLALALGAVALLLAIVIGAGWWYVGTTSFAGLVRLRIEKTLESHLGRTVSIGSVSFDLEHHPSRVVLNDVRIANAPGGVHPYFATVKQVVISGGVESFWSRRIRVGRIDVVQPHLFFEVFPAGSKLQHNFPHWQAGPKGKYEIVHAELGMLFVTHGAFDFLDRRHDIAAVATELSSQMKITLAKDVYEGTMASSLVNVRIQDYKPFQVDLRGGFYFTNDALTLRSVAMHGRDMAVFASGRIAPLSDANYNLRVTSQLGLSRVREIFAVNKVLDGTLSLDTRLRGNGGTFSMSGGWVSPKISADAYDLTALRGSLNVTDKNTSVDVASARYGGGSISAHYVLPGYDEPYPMSVDLRYNGVSLEKLFDDWGISGTGLRGGATGRLAYHWNKDKVLEGAGSGNATLARSTTAFSNAKYPMPLTGGADFTLDRGVVTFRKASLATSASQIELSGTLRIEDVAANLAVRIHSSDFTELDQIGYNFALSAGKKSYTLLGLGGAGDISGTIRGPIKRAMISAHIVSSGTKYNNAPLGEAEIDLRYDGVKSILTFDHATFRQSGGTLALTGTITLPDRGPSPIFDLAVDATGYPVDRAVAIVDLPLKGIRGSGTGRLLVTGTPENGRVRFAGLTIAEGKSRLQLRGDIDWSPGKGNIKFDLDVNATSFPVAQLVTFLDLGTFPVTGDLTGSLHLAGPKAALEGGGSVTVANGSLFGEPIQSAKATLAFSTGKLRATDVAITAPSGSVAGEAELNLATNEFSYTIKSSSIDLSKVHLLQSLNGLFGGNLTITSTGAGTFEHPEVVLEATLNQATVRGLSLPEGAPPPSLYLAIRNSQLVVRGNLAGIVTIEGDGTVGQDLSVDGLVHVRIPDIARLVAVSPSTATLPAAGSLAVDLRLGGKLSSLEALTIDATFPQFALRLSDHEFTAARPIRISLRGGRVTFDDLEIQHPGASLAVSGFIGLTGDRPLGVNVRGGMEAALLQLFVHGLRADGRVNVAAGISGTMAAPRITGTAEIQNAQFRFPGFPQIIDNVTGTLVFRGDRVDIDSLHASLGGGTVVAGGFLTVDGLKPQRARISLQGTGVAIRYFEGMTIDGDFNLLLSGDMDRMTLQGDVNVNRALYFKDFDFTAAFLNVMLTRKSITPIVGATWQDRVDLRIHINAPETIAVRNNIADVTGSAQIDVNGTLANPAVLGLVTLDEGGRVRLQNVDYRVVRGSINFQNPFRIDPYFDITIEGRVSGGGVTSELESGQVDVTINLTGTIDRFTPTITSDPPASDITLFSLLGFGGLASPQTGGTTAAPGMLGQSLLFQGLSGLLGNRILPFADTFSIDPGQLDTSGDPGTKVTIEKRISNSVRVVVIYNLNHAHSRALVEWQVNPDWTLQFTRDEVRKEYRAEARFRRRYEGHWAWGGNGRPVTLFASLAPLDTERIPPQPVEAPAAPLPPPTGPNVVQIDFRADASFDTGVLASYVAQHAGQPLSIRSVQSSIKSLFATGDFRDIRVETKPVAGGVDLTFVLSLNYRVAEIHFDGLRGTDRDRSERDTSVHVGDVLSLNAVDRSATAVQDFLQRSGYVEATVDPETQFERPRSRAIVIFHVVSGPRAKVGSVTIQGDTAPFTTAELITQMKNGPGKTFLVANARSDADRMERFMIRRNYRRADVRYLGDTYDAATKTVVLRYTATAGPVVKVEVSGVPEKAVRGIVQFRKNQAYSEDVIDKAAEDIVTHYQQLGFFNATADTESRLEGNTWITRFNVNPGQHFDLKGVTFSGNQKVADKTLQGIIQTAPTGAFHHLVATIFRRPTGVTQAQLSSDRDAIESYYRLNGFSEATVGTPTVTTNTADSSMAVDFPITEGAQTIVSAVRVEGNQQVPADKLPQLSLKPGAPLNPQLLRADLIALQSFYADRGNAEVQVTPRPEISADKTAATVTYVVAEGPKASVADVVVRGNTYTGTNVILRTAQLDRGDPFSYTSILEAQRDLYRLGIFQRVDIQPEQSGTSVADRNVVIQVEEGKDLTLAGSLGATKQSDLPFSVLGSASIANRNLFGTGRYLGLELIASQERSEGFLTYREPFLGPYNVPVEATLFQSDEHRPSAHIRQRGASIELSKVARLQTRWSVRYEYRIGNCLDGTLCDEAKQALLPGVDRSITDIRIASVTPTFFWDRRDDPIDPHRGFFTTALVEYAFPLFSADSHFLKEFGQASYYLPVSDRSVFAFSTRIGFIEAFGQVTDVNGVVIQRPVPFTERFTGGGPNSHRAYALDLLGTLCPPTLAGCKGTLIRLLDANGDPTSTIAPIGGNGEFITNIEYRFPIFSSVGGSIFTDAGNVFADPKIDLTDLRWGVGAGVRYLSPVGPLRFDIGYKLHRNAYERQFEKPFAYSITIGYAF